MISSDTEALRKKFPLICREQSPLVYLDNAATTQKPMEVIEAVQRFYLSQNANIHRGIYDLAAEADALYEGTRDKVAAFIHAPARENIVFTHGCTEAINLVAHSFLGPRLEAGDEVLVSAMEHHANLVPWQALCQARAARLRVLPINSRGEWLLDHLDTCLTPKTRLVAAVHVSNSLGTINPVRALIEAAHRKDIPVLIDGAQSIAHMPVDVQTMDCDFFTFSGHKMYGPTGIGVLYGKARHLEEMGPYQLGGGMIRSVSFEKTTYARVPHRFEAGTPHIAGAAGMGAAIDALQGWGWDLIQERESSLSQYTLEALQSIPGLQLIGQAPHRAGIFSFTLPGIHPHDVATFLNASGIAIRAGHHCTQPVMDFFEVPATSRVSLAVYNSREDIDQLTEALRGLQDFFG